MSHEEIDEQLAAYARLSQEQERRFRILVRQVWHATKYTPIWDSATQRFRFVHKTKGDAPKKIKLYPWFGNTNRKKKRAT